MSTELLPCIELEPKTGAATASVVWLHGLGADGNDFVPIVPMLGLGDAPIRFVFPHAPSIPVTVNGGMVMPAWYDILGIELSRELDVAGIERSSAQLEALLEREQERGIEPQRIIIAGFSQGGVIALHRALRRPEPPAGVVALSTYLAPEEGLEPAAPERRLSIFQAHGTLDPLVLCERGEKAREALAGLGHDVSWHEYPMEHQVCAEEIEALGGWIAGRLGLS